MFANEHGTPAFEEFLAFLGNRIRLHRFHGFTGGLDTERDSTGSVAVHTLFRGYELIFHVSTYLPFSLDDPQQLARKRHLGNDVVLLVFKEGNTPYVPFTVSSAFNHVILVIQPISYLGETRYRLAVASKERVSSFGPELPEPALFFKDDVFREFLLTKMINGERAAMKADQFARSLSRTRADMLVQIVQAAGQ